MKVALITDTHWGARNDSLNFIDFYEKFYSTIFFPTLEKYKIDIVLMLGDTFDRRKFINYITWNKAKKIYFDELKRRKIKTYIITGNHDTSYKNTNEVNSPELLLNDYDNITLINEPKTISINEFDVCMIPWICTDNYQKSMEELKTTKASICCGHFEIEGFSMYRGAINNEGLSRKIFQKFDFTFSGHYHHKSYEEDIYYLGNPYELTWQDYDDPRGFHIFDFKNRKLSFIENTYKMFNKIFYDDKNKTISEMMSFDFEKYSERYVKVIVENKTNPYFFDKFMENLYKVNPIDIVVVEDFSELTENDNGDIVDQAEDTMSILDKFVDGMEKDSIDKIKLKNLFHELYHDAINMENVE